jgi:hypothetical protein
MPHPCPRVVPKNLFLSAQAALSEEAIQKKRVTKSNLADLCTLVTLSMLYDRVETLGTREELDQWNKPNLVEGYENIRELAGFEVSPQVDFEEVLRHSMGYAIGPFDRAGVNIDRDQLRNELANSLRQGISTSADYWEQFTEGERLFLKRPVGSERSIEENFWLRSFLYAGLAEFRQGVLIPDSVRSWGFPSDFVPRHDYGRDLEEAIQQKYPPEKLRKVILGSPIPVPAFAAAVFKRTGGDRRRMREEWRQLREEMAPVRSALAGLQWERAVGDYRGFATLFGKPGSLDSQLAVDGRMADAVQTLRGAKFPLSAEAVALKPVFDLGWSLYSMVKDLISDPPKAFSAGKAAIETAIGVRNQQAMEDPTAFLEVHYRLGWDLRAWFNGGIHMDKLFGGFDDDEPTPPRS